LTSIDSSIVSIIRKLAWGGKGEHCGFLLGTGEKVVIVFPVRNVSSNPLTEFYMDPAGILAAHRLAENLGLQVKAIYHTHPGNSSEPSSRDLEGMKNWPIPWLIVSRSNYRIINPRDPSSMD